MNHRILISIFSLLLICVTSLFAQQKVSILGDSYSTFHGFVTPDTNYCWYGVPGENRNNDVKKVEDTWWYRFIDINGCKLEINNSFSGSTVCNTGYKKADYTDRSFITRMNNLGQPDIILIFGGTNDSWAQAPIGDYKYADWTKEELFSFRPAFCMMLDYITKHYPDAKVYNITNTELSEAVTTSMDEICSHFGITNIRLRDIDKQSGHPSIAGMKSICEQVMAASLLPAESSSGN